LTFFGILCVSLLKSLERGERTKSVYFWDTVGLGINVWRGSDERPTGAY